MHGIIKITALDFVTTVSQSLLSLSGFEQPDPNSSHSMHMQRQVNSHMFSVLRTFS
jgi:hypothetical protein